jgi:hypothetical protein
MRISFSNISSYMPTSDAVTTKICPIIRFTKNPFLFHQNILPTKRYNSNAWVSFYSACCFYRDAILPSGQAARRNTARYS